MPESCVALKRASVTSDLGRDRVLLVRHGRRAATAAELDLVAGLRHQRDVLAELAEAAGDQRQPAGELGDAVALAVPLRRVAEPEPCGERRCAPRRALSPSLSSVPAAPPNCTTSSVGRIALASRVAMPDQRRAPARDPVGDA